MHIPETNHAWPRASLPIIVGLSCLLLTGFAITGDSADPPKKSPEPAAAIKRVLNVQRDAWNRGSIDDFMEHYWKSKNLTFSSGGKTTRGWTETKANYKRRYATRADMGKVTFDQIEVTSLGESAALVLGRWRLDREAGAIGGNFSLVLRQIEGRWVIIHDHTSRSEELPKQDGQ